MSQIVFFLRCTAALYLCVGYAFGTTTTDEIHSLPTYGPLKGGKQYAGFVDVNSAGLGKLHYWFAEADPDVVSIMYDSKEDVPLLIWLNGGPGASSLTGLLAENLGPQKISANGTLSDNAYSLASQGYHLLTVDNPVGSGYSYTTNENYVKSEGEMREQFVFGLRQFYETHKEYKNNPLWVTGESYAARYVPNVALEIAVNATEIPLKGIVVGNGIYNLKTQVPTMSTFAFGAGLLDVNGVKEMQERESRCVEALSSHPHDAGVYCENITTHWLFSDEGTGKLFYYDIGLEDATFFDDLTDAMSVYLNREDVKRAVHAEGANWTQSDETGPVADALISDWSIPSDPVVEKLLSLGYPVRMYNGVRDASSCNHIGNLQVALDLQWSGAADFAKAANRPWPSSSRVLGHVRGEGLFKYATVLRTGHLVPTVVPESYAILLSMLLRED